MLEVNFFWPPASPGPTARYTAPLQRWDVTTFSGVTEEPMLIVRYSSQTYRPRHHNFTEEFIFEPLL